MRFDFSAPSFWRLPFWICLIAVLVLALLPPSIDMPTTGWDKLNHALAFGVLALLSSRAYPGHYLRLLILLLAYGGLIEVLQSFTTYRFAEWADLLADGIGLVMALLLVKLVAVLLRKRGIEPNQIDIS